MRLKKPYRRVSSLFGIGAFECNWLIECDCWCDAEEDGDDDDDDDDDDKNYYNNHYCYDGDDVGDENKISSKSL